jgi:hypothetical protein
MEQKNFFQSKIFTKILYVVGILIIALIIFQAGMFVGFRKAEFSGKFGNNYRETFGGPRGGFGIGMMQGFFGDENFPSAHGAVGKIIKINLPTLVVIGPDNVEKVVLIKDDTQIVEFRQQIKPADLKLDDYIVVIGTPNNSSQIEAKLIRIMPAPNQMMQATTTTVK